MSEAAGEMWTVTFRVMPAEVPAVHRVRALLKYMLRDLRMRAVCVRDTTPVDIHTLDEWWLLLTDDEVRALVGGGQTGGCITPGEGAA